jgi:hypothetical protein
MCSLCPIRNGIQRCPPVNENLRWQGPNSIYNFHHHNINEGAAVFHYVTGRIFSFSGLLSVPVSMVRTQGCRYFGRGGSEGSREGGGLRKGGSFQRWIPYIFTAWITEKPRPPPGLEERRRGGFNFIFCCPPLPSLPTHHCVTQDLVCMEFHHPFDPYLIA